ncbi:tetratricopeptide repeat protein [Radiobacillus kanasensis]|uniref:tetratricopeptide repeat protein n=1 Tax=Radiobacillus kanasensis TaxID=2844358 RepID=UPI001E2F5482|nr:tetratricopeptide repeat protein [Radiobacillus kanasensis]UFT97961.1 tetratricopeptide repeat protein [Radiobacillus kanasensis]
MKNFDNVIMFPGLQKRLENESLEALKDKRYDDALQSFNELLENDVDTHEIQMGKLICLMEIGNYDEVEDVCRALIAKEDQHFYDYIHIYLTCLFQTSQYRDLMEELDQIFEKSNIPTIYKNQFWQLYEISKKLLEDKEKQEIVQFMEDFKRATKQQDTTKQWSLVMMCQELEINGNLPFIRSLLIDDTIHPVVKTALLEWMRNQEVDARVEVSKFDTVESVKPNQLSTIMDDPFTVDIFNLLSGVEQDNPSQYELIQRVLKRYLYVLYPFMPDQALIPTVVNALIHIGKQYMGDVDSVEMDNNMDETIQQILQLEALYLSVIEE